MLCRAEAKYRTLVEQIPAITYISALDDPGSCTTSARKWKPWATRRNTDWPSLHTLQANQSRGHRARHRRHRPRPCQLPPLHCEYRIITRNGRTLWVRDEATVVLGEPLFLQGLLIDISEMKAVVEELRQHRYLF